MTALSDALAESETVRERLPLRTGGSVAVTDDHLLVAADDEVTRVALDDVAEVTIEDFDFFLAVLSAVLVGWGLYSVPRNAPLGIAFAAFGALSLYWTYYKRGKVSIAVAGRAKPVSVFPTDPEEFYDALEPLVAAEPSEPTSDGDNEPASDESE